MALDVLTTVAAFSAIITAIVTAFFFSKQTHQRSKIASADLSLRMLDIIRRKDFREILIKIRNHKTDELSDIQIHKILTHYEYLAAFEQDKLLNFDHVLHQHGRNIKMLYDDMKVKRIFDNTKKENPMYNYTKIENLFLKINDKLG